MDKREKKDGEFVLLETTLAGNLFPVGSIIKLNGEQVFWRDFDPKKFLFKKRNFVAIFQDDVVIKFLEKIPIKSLYFRDFRKGKVYKASLEAFKTARLVNMRGRKQRGVSLTRFEEVRGLKVKNTRPDNKRVIN